MTSQPNQYQPFTLNLIWQEIAPHTWPAAIIPVLTAFALASITGFASNWYFMPEIANTPIITLTIVWALLLICVLMQSSVNVFNDYYDYVKGVDTIENSSDDVTDAVLVYNNINPKDVLKLAVGMLIAAFVIGVYIIIVAGWIPLAIGIVGAIIVALYSAGKTPISYYPIGEAVSGIVMGGLITLACYYVLTGSLNFMVLLYSIPCIIGIGLIMLTNNTCDIVKDAEAHRKTLPVLIGHDKARNLYHMLLLVWICAIVVMSIVALILGNQNVVVAIAAVVMVIPFMLLIVYPQLRALWRNPLNANMRDIAMPQILSVNITLGLFYIATLLIGQVL